MEKAQGAGRAVLYVHLTLFIYTHVRYTHLVSTTHLRNPQTQTRADTHPHSPERIYLTNPCSNCISLRLDECVHMETDACVPVFYNGNRLPAVGTGDPSKNVALFGELFKVPIYFPIPLELGSDVP